jgi:hypothetical protein
MIYVANIKFVFNTWKTPLGKLPCNQWWTLSYSTCIPCKLKRQANKKYRWIFENNVYINIMVFTSSQPIYNSNYFSSIKDKVGHKSW